MKIVSMLLMLSLIATSYVKKDDIAKVLKENPEILSDAIKANPIQFLEAIQFTAENAKKEMAKKKEEDEKKKFEESFKNPLIPQIRKNKIIKKNKNTPITLIKYSDFQYPFCQRSFNNIQTLKKKYRKNIRFIYKHLPLNFHKKTIITSQYHKTIRLQNKEKAQTFHNEIFKDISKLKINEKFLKSITKKVDTNQKRIDKDKSNTAIINRIKKDQAEAAKFKIQKTPDFLLNNIPLRNTYPVSEFDKIINHLVKDRKVKLN